MIQLKKRIRALRANPRLYLSLFIMPGLRQLRYDLGLIAESGDTPDAIVHFFSMVSMWHDRGLNDVIAEFERVNYGQFDAVLEKLRALQGYFVNAGRDDCGWNRTKRGEMVTPDKVFLGNIYGLFTQPVSFWRQRKDEPKGGWGFSPRMEHLNAYDVVSQQARQFMTSYIGPICEIVDALEIVARPSAA